MKFMKEQNPNFTKIDCLSELIAVCHKTTMCNGHTFEAIFFEHRDFDGLVHVLIAISELTWRKIPPISGVLHPLHVYPTRMNRLHPNNSKIILFLADSLIFGEGSFFRNKRNVHVGIVLVHI